METSIVFATTLLEDGAPIGIPDEPVMLEVERRGVKSISGGSFAKRWKEWMESWDDEFVYRAGHFSSVLGEPAWVAESTSM